MAKRTRITQKELIQGDVFTTRKGGRYYLVQNPKGLNKIMNDINKTLYGYVEYIDSEKLVAVTSFFGVGIRAKIALADCFKLIDN